MTTAQIVIVVVIALVLIALVSALAVMSRRRGRRQLRRQFGPEYERTLATTGDQKETDARLQERVKGRQRLEIRPLSGTDRDAFAQEWRRIQSRFVDAPDEALADAEGLLNRVMGERGYPVDDFDQQADLVSVDHPELVDNYRKAHVVRDATHQGPVDTEQQRHAFLAYRSLFAELLDQPASERPQPRTASS